MCKRYRRLRFKYSQTCMKRSPFGPRKHGLLRQMTSKKRFNSNGIFYERTRKRWHFNTDDCSVKVTAWTGLTVINKSICPGQVTVKLSQHNHLPLHNMFGNFFVGTLNYIEINTYQYFVATFEIYVFCFLQSLIKVPKFKTKFPHQNNWS